MAKPGMVEYGSMTTTFDLKEHDPEYFRASEVVEEVKLGPAYYLHYEGAGAPGGVSFQTGIQAVFAVANAIKEDAKHQGQDFLMPPLEAQFWRHDEDGQPLARDEWTWNLLIRMPPGTNNAASDRAKDSVSKQRGDVPVRKIRLEKVHVGRAVQVLHVGDEETVADSVERLTAYIHERGLQAGGPYHEVYLSDPARTPGAERKTIVRIPVV